MRICKKLDDSCETPMECASKSRCKYMGMDLCDYSQYVHCRKGVCRAVLCPRMTRARTGHEVMLIALALMDV